MKHRIDPKIGCMFEALLEAKANRRLLIHFLNAVRDVAKPSRFALLRSRGDQYAGDGMGGHREFWP